MTKIKLTRGKFAIVDDIDAHLKNYKWGYSSSGYAVRGCTLRKYKSAKVFLHHAVIGRHLNGMEVDHIDNNPLNNRRNNLRFVTKRQNALNRKVYNNGKLPGVHKTVKKYGNKIHEYFDSKISIEGKSINLGSFKTPQEASRAYLKAVSALT